MSSSSSVVNRAWIVAASVGALEALKKDQSGICKLSQTMRSMQQHAKTHLRSYSQAHTKLSSSYSALFSKKLRDEEPKQSEESMKNVMYLNSWGPN